MEILNHVEAPVYHVRKLMTQSSNPMSQELIEISSDEEGQEDVVYNGQPESSGKSQTWTNFKRVSEAGPEPNDQYLNVELPEYDIGYARSKRQRLNDDFSDPQIVRENLQPITEPLDRFLDNIQRTKDANGQGLVNREGFFDASDFLLDIPYDDPEDQEWLDNAMATLPPDFSMPVLESASPQDAAGIKGKTVVNAHASPKPKPAPYYDDIKYEVRMYCGPGYEKFPIVLGTIPEHKEICRKWDTKNLRRMAHQQTKDTTAPIPDLPDNDNAHEYSSSDDSDAADEQGTQSTRKTEIESECLKNIVEVLPDIKRDFVLKIIRKCTRSFKFDANEEIEVRPSSAEIMAEILDLPEYPKQETPGDAPRDEMDGTGVTIQWQKGDIECKTYQRDAVCLLAGQFDHIPTHFIHKTVHDKRSLFDSYLYLNDLEANYLTMQAGERPYRRCHDARKVLEKKYSPKGRGSRSPDQWDNLVNEIQAAKQRIKRDQIKAAKRMEAEQMEAVNLAQHKARGDIVECQCCFDDEIPLNRAISCEATQIHWFCFGCVVRLAENQVGLMKYLMKCMDGSGCEANLSPSGVQQAIPPKLGDKLAFYKQQFEISEACIDGLEQCPFCDFKAICDPVEEDPTFRCQNPECRRVSCRKCHEISHSSKSCEDAKKDKGLSARHRIEEARSEAMLRPCPQCKVKIIKELGCNKMRCSKCGCVMCYVCKADISNQRDNGYDHFNRRGSKCNLYDKGLDRHAREADEAEREAIKKVREENADLDEKQLQIETGSAKMPTGKSKRAEKPRHIFYDDFDRVMPFPNGRLHHGGNFMAFNPAAPSIFQPPEGRHRDIDRIAREARNLGQHAIQVPPANAPDAGRLLYPAPPQQPWGMHEPFMAKTDMRNPFPFDVPNLPQGTRFPPMHGLPGWDNPWEQHLNTMMNGNGVRGANLMEKTQPDAARNTGEANATRVGRVGAGGELINHWDVAPNIEFDMSHVVHGPWADFR